MTILANRLPARQLGQTRPANSTAVSIYAPASHYRTEVRKFVICNTSVNATTFRIFHDEDGTTYNETTALFWNIPIDAGETVTITEEFWINGLNSGNIAIRSGLGNALTFTIYGAEEKIK
jgi:prephenate dehydratase